MIARLPLVSLAGVLLPAGRAHACRGAAPARTGFRAGPLWAWCPAEGRETPHGIDAGTRRCHVCKTSTTIGEGS